MAGWTNSSTFPTTSGAYDTTHNSDYDAFVTRLDATGSSLSWSTFLGSSGWDEVYALALDPSGAVTVAGYTDSPGFPTTPGAYDTTYNGGGDAFVTRLLIAPGPPPCSVGACLDVTGTAAIGNSVGLNLQSPAANATCYVFASLSQNAAGYPVTLGGTALTIHVVLNMPGTISFADPSNTFGPSLTNPVTDANGSWCCAFPIPNDPNLVGMTYYGEAVVTSAAGTWVSNVETVTIQ